MSILALLLENCNGCFHTNNVFTNEPTRLTAGGATGLQNIQSSTNGLSLVNSQAGREMYVMQFSGALYAALRKYNHSSYLDIYDTDKTITINLVISMNNAGGRW